MLRAAREMATSNVHVVFGCGGDRDRGKRPLMGEIAGRLADRVIVTSDNPRSEDPEAIIEETLAGVGRPVEGMTVRVIRIDDGPIAAWSDDLLVSAGEIGEFVVQGPVVTRSYFNRPSSTGTPTVKWYRL